MNLMENQNQTMVIMQESSLTEIIERSVEKSVAKAMGVKSDLPPQPPERRTLHSIRELAEFIGCSTPTAHGFKASGRIPYRQIGRKVMFDTFDVLNAMDQSNKKSRK
jgi:hypothetical protein